jgi:hypothetical protein
MALAVSAIREYPNKRGGPLPPSPLGFLKASFGQLLNSPRRPDYYMLFEKGHRSNIDLLAQNAINQEEPYDKIRKRFIAQIINFPLDPTYSITDLGKIADIAPHKETAWEDQLFELSKADRADETFINLFFVFIIHQSAHSSPRAILNYFIEILETHVYINSLPEQKITSITREYVEEYVRDIFALFAYYERCSDIGLAFFSPYDELLNLPKIRGFELEDHLRMFSNAYAMRFIESLFQVVTRNTGAGTLHRNTISIEVDPKLRDVCLPVDLLSHKVACNIKNSVRMATEEEAAKGYSLRRVLDDQPIKEPICIRIECKKVNAKVWEMRFTDTGRGIVVKDTFIALAKAVERIPKQITPALRAAVLKWKRGDAYAFNNVPLEDIWQAIFHFGISVGHGAVGSGMGLWGTTALMTRLGAQIKIGCTPGSGGYYESILLPVDLSVRPEEVAAVAGWYWS